MPNRRKLFAKIARTLSKACEDNKKSNEKIKECEDEPDPIEGFL